MIGQQGTLARAGGVLDARTRIIEAAEKLFAESGYHAVSLRAIMADAQVNFSAAHYYFGSKKGLLKAVFDQRLKEINPAREGRLRACLEQDGEPAPVEKVLEAYIAPALEVVARPGGRHFIRVAALAHMDPSAELRDLVGAAYDATARLFISALRKSCPHLDERDLFWRLHCVYGAMVYVRANNGRVARILGMDDERLSDFGVREALDNVIPFLAAGFGVPTRGRPSAKS